MLTALHLAAWAMLATLFLMAWAILAALLFAARAMLATVLLAAWAKIQNSRDGASSSSACHVNPCHCHHLHMNKKNDRSHVAMLTTTSPTSSP